MLAAPPLPASQTRLKNRRGMTLVEVMIASTIAALLMTGVFAAFLTLAQTAAKNERLEKLSTESRTAQELVSRELMLAINTFDENVALRNRPTFEFSDGAVSPSYRQLTYRTPVGPPGSLTSTVPATSSTLTFQAPAVLKPVVGDFLVLDTPKLGRGIAITAVTDNRGGGDGNVTVTLASTLQAGTVLGSDPSAPAGSRVEIQRERRMVVDSPATGAKVTSLLWYENTATPGTVQVITDQISASRPFIFRLEPNDANAEDVAIGWALQLNDPGKVGGQSGRTAFFTTSSVGGAAIGKSSLAIPKSGNALVLSNPFAAVSTSVSTTTTTTTSVTTSTTTSTSTTSLTTSTSTTSTTSSTSKSTSTSTTSTTKSTTKTTTTKTTTKSTTKTTSVSTSKSTTKSTTKTTTTKTTTKSTTKTTSVSTSKSTSTTSTTKSTSKSTSTSTTSTTSKSTTKTTTSSTTSKSTSSTSIPFDG
jgi:prepilin-type N-terminal cleavage/methylation domain-containing protein